MTRWHGTTGAKGLRRMPCSKRCTVSFNYIMHAVHASHHHQLHYCDKRSIAHLANSPRRAVQYFGQRAVGRDLALGDPLACLRAANVFFTRGCGETGNRRATSWDASHRVQSFLELRGLRRLLGLATTTAALGNHQLPRATGEAPLLSARTTPWSCRPRPSRAHRCWPCGIRYPGQNIISNALLTGQTGSFCMKHLLHARTSATTTC